MQDAELDLPVIEQWLDREGVDIGPLRRATRLVGGHSNLTFRVESQSGRSFVLRRPPLHGVTESAHDVHREFFVMEKLQATPIPVPHQIAFCSDDDVLGAPFYLMEFVDGVVLRTPSDTERELEPSVRRAVSFDFFDVLSRLHGLDVDEAGLGALGRRDDYVWRQLRRWRKQAATAGVRDHPLVRELSTVLERNVPPQQAVALVHGDYRLDNCIVSAEGALLAVVDWELCTLGDPLADLGAAIAYWVEDGETPYEELAAPTCCPGMPSRAEVIDRYAQASALDLTALPYYVALSSWKLAVIFEGVYARYTSGAMGARGGNHAALLRTADRLLARAEAELATYSVRR